jgi:hypothetical protein
MFIFTLNVPEVDKLTAEIANPGYVGNLIVIGLFLVIILIYGFLLEKHTRVANILALYISVTLINYWPTTIWFAVMNEWWVRSLMVVALNVIVIILFWIINLFRVSYGVGFIVRWWQAIILGFMYAGLLTSLLLAVIPSEYYNQFSPRFLKIFIGETARFMWLLLPITSLIFVKQKRGPGRPSY